MGVTGSGGGSAALVAAINGKIVDGVFDAVDAVISPAAQATVGTASATREAGEAIECVEAPQSMRLDRRFARQCCAMLAFPMLRCVMK